MQLLKKVSFGARVAEEETNELGNYFVETDQWERIFNGEIDVVKGDKGAGKSAIYSLLSTKSDDLFDKRILLITAEEPRGTPVFKELVTDPPAGEAEFIGLWKLYLLSLIAKKFQEFGINNKPAKQLIDHLSDQGLIPPVFELRKLLKIVRQYAQRYFAPTVEATVIVDPTGAHTFTGKITPGEPRPDQTKALPELRRNCGKGLAKFNCLRMIISLRGIRRRCAASTASWCSIAARTPGPPARSGVGADRPVA